MEPNSAINQQWEESMNEAKPYQISKWEVWEAYRRVRANQGAAGVDEQSIEDFEKDLKRNLYKIWNRMSSGSYFPPPVLTVKIPKAGGGERRLGIPTVSDRVAQMVVVLIKLSPCMAATVAVGRVPMRSVSKWMPLCCRRWSSKCARVALKSC